MYQFPEQELQSALHERLVKVWEGTSREGGSITMDKPPTGLGRK